MKNFRWLGAAAGVVALLAGGLVGVAAPVQAYHSSNYNENINTAANVVAVKADRFSALWGHGRAGGWQTGLSVGPEVGWNAGLEDMKPPSAAYYRLWDMKVAWRDVNPNPGVFDFSRLDRRIAQVESWGGKPILVLGLTPKWAAGECTSGDPLWGAGSACPPENERYWIEYVEAVADRYGNRIGAYEIWNEANLQTFWAGTPQQMARMTFIAGLAIKNRSQSLVLAPSVTTRLKSGANFTRDFLADDGWNPAYDALWRVIDAWTIHSYPKGNAGPTTSDACAERAAHIILWQKALLESAVKRPEAIKPIWDTEINYGLAGPGATPKTTWSDEDAAALLTCTYQDSRALGIATTVWYEYTADNYDLLGVQMNPNTPNVNAAWAALPSTITPTNINPWIPNPKDYLSINIIAERTTVEGEPGIKVEGTTTGFAKGAVMVPWLKFPGETSYSEGSARPGVDKVRKLGKFFWGQKTGKTISVYFTSEDGDVKSDPIIIQAKGKLPSEVSNRFKVETASDVRALKPKKVGGLEPDTIAKFNPPVLKALRPAHVGALQPDQISAMKPKQFQKLKPLALAALNPDHIQSLAEKDLRGLPLGHIRALTEEQLAQMAQWQLGCFKPLQVSALTPQQVSKLTAPQRIALTL